jgi:NAD(P)H-flavin reductase
LFQIGVRRVGNVTKHLHSLKPGEKVGVRGPFGTHFPVDGAMKGKHVLFIGGGIGLVPLRSAINYVMDNRKDYNDVTILFGCKSPAERLFTKELALWAGRKDVNFKETVDKGDEKWKGNVGVITTLLQRPVIDPRSTVQVSMDLSKLVSVDDPRNTVAVICGPPVMYKFVILELKRLEVPPENTFVSLERRMKCGVGKCGHCQINGLYVCQEGPVFNFADLMNVQEAIR